MKVQCPFTGASWQQPGYGSAIHPHPIFSVSVAALVDRHLPAFINGELEPEDIHCLGCAFLASTGLVRWSAPLHSHSSLQRMWLSSMELLSTTALRVTASNRDNLPQFHITTNNATNFQEHSENIPEFLRAIHSTLNEAAFSPADLKSREAYIYNRERVMRILRSPGWITGDAHRLPELIANWAIVAGDFPRFMITLPGTTTPISCAQFWKSLIVKIFRAHRRPEAILSESVNIADVRELLEHCEQNIEYGTINAEVLLAKLRETVQILEEFSDPCFAVLSDSVSPRESLGMGMGIVSAAEKRAAVIAYKETLEPEPKRSQFPTQIAYVRAKLAWSRNRMGMQK